MKLQIDTNTIIIQARMNSKRLPGKMLMSIKGKSLIEFVLERVSLSRKVGRIIIATSIEKSDDPLFDFCQNREIECYRGSLNNVVERFLEIIRKYGLKSFIRICGDSPLIDSGIIDDIIKVFKTGKYDIVTNILKRTFPEGESVEMLKSDVFINASREISSSDDLEHVTSYFYKNCERYNIFNLENKEINCSEVNLSVDTPEDFNIFKKILSRIKEDYTVSTWEEIVKIYNDIEK